MKKIKFILLALLLLIPYPIIADENDGEIIINYYDDSAMLSPVEGSTWRLYKVADIETIVEGNNDNVHKIIPLVEGLDNIDKETLPDEVLELIGYTKVNESQIEINNGVSNPAQAEDSDGEAINNQELIFYEDTTINGKIVFNGLEDGVYLGVEIKAAEHHMLSTPFLVSLPNTNQDGNIVSMSVTVEPKAILAGNLSVTKILNGDNTDKYAKWDMILTLPEGTYRYETSSKEKGTVSNGDIISIKGGESFVIYDLLAGADYEVKEVQANKDGYSTQYKNSKGQIKFAENKEVTVTNNRSHIVNTGVFGNGDNGNGILLLIPLSILIILYFSISAYKENKDKSIKK